MTARKQILIMGTSPEEQVRELVAELKQEGFDFSVRCPVETPIEKADRVVSAGMGVASLNDMKMIRELCEVAGAAVGSSKPAALQMKYVEADRFVGLSGKKFKGSLYIACGISGAEEHLKGIEEADTVVAINLNLDAPFFENCDYGVVGDYREIVPLLIEELKK